MEPKQQRITVHPILSVGRKDEIKFSWNGVPLSAKRGEMISTALFASGIKVFGTHHKDGSSMGIFCANGQCSQCTVLADGVPVKACVTEVRERMDVRLCAGTPQLAEDGHALANKHLTPHEVPVIRTPALIVGGGPAGLQAAIQLASIGIRSVLVDDKPNLGGKLVLQTHTFFGSVDDCYAGSRGIDIAIRLENEARSRNEITIMTSAQAVAVFSDNRVGVVREGRYLLIEPETILVAAGAREKALSFPGCDLPGVYGAGAFQTLVNRDLIRSGSDILIVGGGNVGLIAAYHALQADMNIVGLIEAMPRVSGYKVHQDKIARLGVPILLSHTILSANAGTGKNGEVVSATIAQVDAKFKPIEGTEKTIVCDTILVAAGLSSCNEFFTQAKAFGLKAFLAGDAEEIAEASAAMYSGKIAALKMANALGYATPIPDEYYQKLAVLKSRPGKTVERQSVSQSTSRMPVYPVFHCFQEIPCNPCVSACGKKFIKLKGNSGSILDLPYYDGDNCSCCLKCVAICPGLAITIVDRRKAEAGRAHAFVPYELLPRFKIGDQVRALDADGALVEEAKVVDIINKKWQDRTLLIKLEVSEGVANRVAGIQYDCVSRAIENPKEVHDPGDNIVCRCEKVKDREIRQMIHEGVTDMNTLKVLRCTMGACGGKTCVSLIKKIFSEEGGDPKTWIEPVQRPLNMEISLGTFANIKVEAEPNYDSDI